MDKRGLQEEYFHALFEYLKKLREQATLIEELEQNRGELWRLNSKKGATYEATPKHHETIEYFENRKPELKNSNLRKWKNSF